MRNSSQSPRICTKQENMYALTINKSTLSTTVHKLRLVCRTTTRMAPSTETFDTKNWLIWPKPDRNLDSHRVRRNSLLPELPCALSFHLLLWLHRHIFVLLRSLRVGVVLKSHRFYYSIFLAQSRVIFGNWGLNEETSVNAQSGYRKVRLKYRTARSSYVLVRQPGVWIFSWRQWQSVVARNILASPVDNNESLLLSYHRSAAVNYAIFCFRVIIIGEFHPISRRPSKAIRNRLGWGWPLAPISRLPNFSSDAEIINEPRLSIW